MIKNFYVLAGDVPTQKQTENNPQRERKTWVVDVFDSKLALEVRREKLQALANEYKLRCANPEYDPDENAWCALDAQGFDALGEYDELPTYTAYPVESFR